MVGPTHQDGMLLGLWSHASRIYVGDFWTGGERDVVGDARYVCDFVAGGEHDVKVFGWKAHWLVWRRPQHPYDTMVCQ